MLVFLSSILTNERRLNCIFFPCPVVMCSADPSLLFCTEPLPLLPRIGTTGVLVHTFNGGESPQYSRKFPMNSYCEVVDALSSPTKLPRRPEMSVHSIRLGYLVGEAEGGVACVHRVRCCQDSPCLCLHHRKMDEWPQDSAHSARSCLVGGGDHLIGRLALITPNWDHL